jgi:PAS domain S-box-containing protein
MNEKIKPTPFDQRLFLIFIVTFATMTAFEFAGQFLYPYPPDWRSNLITSLFAGGLAVIIAYFPLNAYYAENARVLSEMERRRFVETELRESESRISSIIRVAPIGIGVASDRRIQTVNDRFCDITGYTAEELTGKTTRVLFPTEEDYDSLGREIYAQIAQKGSGEVETRWQKKDGTIIDVLLSSTPVDPSDLSLGVTFTALDITERKRAEAALRESEEKFRTIFYNANDAIEIHATNPDGLPGKYLDVNDVGCRMLQYTRDEMLAMSPSDIATDYHSRPLDEIGMEMKTEGSSRFETGHRRKDGTIVPVEINSHVISLPNQEVVVAVVRDITERKRAEAALRESEEKFRMVVENTLDGILIIAMTGEILFGNRALGNVFEVRDGFHPFGTKNVMDFIAPESRSQVLHDFSQVAQGIDSFLMNYRAQTVTGRQIWIESIGKLIQFQNSPAILISIKDITSRKHMEDAILRANKQLNLLTGITRHDINNQLQALNGYVELLHMDVPDPMFETYFSGITEASRRITAMIRFTKEYDKIGLQASVWQDLQTLVNGAGKDAPLGKVLLKNDIPGKTEVFADPLILKVFFNLIENALRHGGRITTIRFSFEACNGDRIIVCEDDGDGVAVEEKEKIFNRGFGKNTGLGLALAREILDITGITIHETGEPGKGARFEMVVPKEAYRIATEQ